MCGIVAYIGNKQAAPILLQGLRRLEYRGYDSAGIAMFDNGKITRVRAVGKIETLVGRVQNDPPAGVLGIGHCLHPQTVVQLSNGRTMYIKDISSGMEVINANVDNGKLSVGRVRASSHSSPRDLFTVRTPISSFVATGKHRTFVYTDGCLKEKEIKDVQPGDFLPLPKAMNIVSSTSLRFISISVKRYFQLTNDGALYLKKEIQLAGKAALMHSSGVTTSYLEHIVANDRNFREDQLEAVYASLGTSFQNARDTHLEPVDTIHGKFVCLPEESTPSIMQILGYFIGDGYAGKRALRFKDMDRQTLSVYHTLIDENFGIKGRITDMRDISAGLLECNSTYLCAWLHENVTKDLYGFISSIGGLPEEQLAAFIRGLFDAEGYIALQSKQLGIGMNNEFLIRSLQLWLLRFEIISSFRIEQPSLEYNKPNASYRLLMSNKESLERFQNTIGFGGESKMTNLQQLISLVGYKRFSFREFPEFPELIFSRVLDIKESASDVDFVYDLEVTGNENFLANSILTHNSRWATHGGVTEDNAHPHADCTNKLALVHNGIIENYREIKERLGDKHHYTSQTDSEVLAHLIESHYQGDLRQAVEIALRHVRGTYGLVVIHQDHPDTIIAARMGSPLVIGIGQDEHFIASDPTPILPHTKKMIFLDDGEIAIVTKEKVETFTLTNQHIIKCVEEIDWNDEQAEKQGFTHFMLKEIFDEPSVFTDAIRGRYNLSEGTARLGGINMSEEEMRSISRVVLIACGTASYAAMVGKYAFERLAGLPTEVDVASEFRYRDPIITNTTLVFGISQSGETADTLAALREAKRRGAFVRGIVNVVGSTIARETDGGTYIHAGPELAVASTKAYTNMVAILLLYALQFGRLRGVSLATGERLLYGLRELPIKMNQILKRAEEIRGLAEKYKNFQNMFFLGRGVNFPVALEGSLKLKEIAYVHSEAYPGGEMKHGPIALLSNNFPVFGIMTKDQLYDKMRSNIQEVRARNAPVILIATEGDEYACELADDIFFVPETMELLQPLLNTIPLQLFAYYVAVALGRDVDRPRNLAKSVTVE